MAGKTIAFIHGAFVTRHCWDHWIERFAARGYSCVALAYPGRDRTVAELRAAPDERLLAGLTLRDVLEHHVRVLRALDEAPLLMLGGAGDHIMPASLNRRNFRRYARSPSITEYEEVPGRAHDSILSGPGWDATADAVLAWAVRHGALEAPDAEPTGPRPAEVARAAR